jgi:hypothetical protein
MRRKKKSKGRGKGGPPTKVKIFLRAYDKAAKILPGSGRNPLSLKEFLILLEAIRKCKARKEKR